MCSQQLPVHKQNGVRLSTDIVQAANKTDEKQLTVSEWC